MSKAKLDDEVMIIFQIPQQSLFVVIHMHVKVQRWESVDKSYYAGVGPNHKE